MRARERGCNAVPTAVPRLFVFSVRAVRYTIAYQVRGNLEPVGAREHLRGCANSREGKSKIDSGEEKECVCVGGGEGEADTRKAEWVARLPSLVSWP